jgi:hypothetical protein
VVAPGHSSCRLAMECASMKQNWNNNSHFSVYELLGLRVVVKQNWRH